MNYTNNWWTSKHAEWILKLFEILKNFSLFSSFCKNICVQACARKTCVWIFEEAFSPQQNNPCLRHRIDRSSISKGKGL